MDGTWVSGKLGRPVGARGVEGMGEVRTRKGGERGKAWWFGLLVLMACCCAVAFFGLF